MKSLYITLSRPPRRVTPPVMCNKTLTSMRYHGMYARAYTRMRLRLRDRVSRPRMARATYPVPAHVPPPLRPPARAKS